MTVGIKKARPFQVGLYSYEGSNLNVKKQLTLLF